MDSPSPVDAAVIEQDTQLLLDPFSDIKHVPEPYAKLIEQGMQSLKSNNVPPGSVLVRRGTPLKLLAVVHDINLEPSWREEWVAEALQEIFGIVAKRRLTSIAMPMLGTVHGRLAPQRFIDMLGKAYRGGDVSCLKHVWIFAPADIDGEVVEYFFEQHPGTL